MPAARRASTRRRRPLDQAYLTRTSPHATPAGRKAAVQTRSQLERDGVPISQLRRCDDEVRDATSLLGAAQALPAPARRAVAHGLENLASGPATSRTGSSWSTFRPAFTSHCPDLRQSRATRASPNSPRSKNVAAPIDRRRRLQAEGTLP